HKKAVIFDIYKTLIDIEIDENNIDTYYFLSRWLSYNGLIIDPEYIFEQYKKICYEKIVSNHESYPDIDVGEVFDEILSNAQKYPAYESRNIVKDICILFRILTTKSIFIYPEAVNMLNLLNGRVRLGIVSNSQRVFTIPELRKFG